MHAIFTEQFYLQAVDRSPVHVGWQPLGAAKPSENWKRLENGRWRRVPGAGGLRCSIVPSPIGQSPWQAMA